MRQQKKVVTVTGMAMVMETAKVTACGGDDGGGDSDGDRDGDGDGNGDNNNNQNNNQLNVAAKETDAHRLLDEGSDRLGQSRLAAI